MVAILDLCWSLISFFLFFGIRWKGFIRFERRMAVVNELKGREVNVRKGETWTGVVFRGRHLSPFLSF